MLVLFTSSLPPHSVTCTAEPPQQITNTVKIKLLIQNIVNATHWFPVGMTRMNGWIVLVYLYKSKIIFQIKGMGVLGACSVYCLGANRADMLQEIVALPLRCLNSNRGSQMYYAEMKQIVYLASLGAGKVEYSKTEKQVFLELDDFATQGQSKTNISAAWKIIWLPCFHHCFITLKIYFCTLWTICS